MGSSQRPRLTLARIMLLIAGIALALAATRLSVAVVAGFASILVVLSGGFLLVLLLDTRLDVIVPRKCPRCGANRLRRLARPFSTIYYYQCAACGMRCKRDAPFRPWQDASGPEDAENYRRKSASGSWLGYSTPDVDDTTCGTLLRNKRHRRAPPVEENAGE